MTRNRLDNLSRAAFCRNTEDDPGDSEARIQLETLKDITWWARFTDEDYENQALENIRTSTSLQEILFILGAKQNDAATAMLRLAPGPCAARRPRYIPCLSLYSLLSLLLLLPIP